MLYIHFNLRLEKITKKGLAPVRMIITFNSNRIRRDVRGVKVKPEDWKNQRIRPNLKVEPYNFHIEHNIVLDELEVKIKKIYRHAILNGDELTKPYVLERLKWGAKKESIMDIYWAFEEFVDTHRTTRAIGTIKKYGSCINFIRDFDQAKNYGLSFQNLDQRFYESFRDYAFLERETMNNYFGKLVAFVKTFMNWALLRGYHSNQEFRKFKRVSNDIEVIYLTMEELLLLYNHKFKTRRLEYVRDFYCFGCFTGLRFSDLSRLRPSNVYDDYLRLSIIKTKSIDHKVPLNKMAIDILEKYKGSIYEPLPRISGQKFNQYIKECCEIVGIDKPVNITRFIGQRRVDRVLPKYKLITSHTARKTFVTNSLILGMNEKVVKNITGHKDEASFMKYLDIAEHFKKNEMSRTWDKI
ncbi:site-specific integrase [Flagellimonas hymeniacidonis]|uniref:Site-specific integrase n=1 Tax=Flagellimonas hymeniacidonis TaxID=2603628 RepID=A0A5C8V984_9FLAO|nr:site-specific integrase [Flagellimonas hymeniacidonis]TXN37749.1 site-specific integrase [Flagellimonas hymeniacidonis]